MSRLLRLDRGGEIYHVLNYANTGMKIFETDEDYKVFESILKEAAEKFSTKLFSYIILPDQFHLVVETSANGDLSKFVGWISNTHTRRWHALRGTVGQGHLYKGRYKSFICQRGNNFFNLVRYTESKAKRDGLTKNSLGWRWSSLYIREKGSEEKKKALSQWPDKFDGDYSKEINKSLNKKDETEIIKSISKSRPYGDEKWVESVAKSFGIEQTLRSIGRPRKNKEEEQENIITTISKSTSPKPTVYKTSIEEMVPRNPRSDVNEEKNQKKGWFNKLIDSFGI